MRVRINLGLDFDGIHTFAAEASEAPGAVDVPKATLERWNAEREAFTVAYLRWKHVTEEVEEFLYRAEQSRAGSRAEPALATAVAAVGRRR
jgi:hypothetical protein